ncbi:MAG: GTP 3',8-cyclase MoaA [Omnitrophica bacterium]|nr:GTP 3',8-cyclase MoaA [Candidatus Omnitrophota bacterium]
MKNRRSIDYLRLSVTDRCNLRCAYCMPRAGIKHKGHSEVLTFEEILKLVNVFVSLGIKKIRLTGGEPLVRKNLLHLVELLSGIDGIEELSLTTNGITLPSCAEDLRRAGVKRINISLDTLDRARFESITGSDCIDQVFCGIQKSKKAGFSSIKLNTVIMRGINDTEIIDFVKFALSNGLVLRFIEFMKSTPLWREDRHVPLKEIMDICAGRFNLKKTENVGPGPAGYYEVEGGGVIGFIKTDENNCANCNRLRLTSTGELKACLYETGGLSLREPLRRGVADAGIAELIAEKMNAKTCVDYRNFESAKDYMCSVGG